MVVASPAWGRYGGVWGRRRVLIIATSSATLAITAFAVLTQASLAGLIAPLPLFLAFLVVRGLWFGVSEAAVRPNAQAYIAETTPDAGDRLRGMSALGAANALSMVVGAAVGGVLAAFGPLVPLWTTPVLLAAAVVMVLTRMTAPAVRSSRGERPAAVKMTDPRVFPFLAVAFGAYTALAFVEMLIGFLLQDRLGIGTERTALLTGIVLVGAGAGLAVSQAVIVPRSGWSPVRLIRTGLVAASGGFLVMLPDLGFWGILAGTVLTGLGLGMVSPSVNTGASLAVGPQEQGATAGLIGSTNALTFVVSPVVATALYAVHPLIPLGISATVCVGSLALALTTRRLDPRASAPAEPLDRP